MKNTRFYHVMLLVILSGALCLVNAKTHANEAQIIAALKQAKSGNWSRASQMMQQVNDPLAKDTLSWLAYTDDAPNAGFYKISGFLRSHGDWPYQNTMRKNAEERLPEGYNNAQIIGWFSSQKPLTADGMNAYLSALMASNRRAEAAKIINDFWPDANLAREGQRTLFSKYQSLISKKSHKERLNNLLHKGQYSNARAIVGVLGSGYFKLAEARIALAQQSNNVSALVSAVPASLQNDEGLLYERLRWRRRNDQNQGMVEILNRAPPQAAMHSPSDWWRERHILARRLIEQKNYKAAYKVVAGHKQKTGFPMSQAQWLSGFLALRFNNEPVKAFGHFQTLYNNVSSPVSKSRGAYWAGRASEAAGNPQVAQQWYAVAARYPTRFYGQTALSKLSQATKPNFGQGVRVSAGARQQFSNQKFAKVARWLNSAGFRKDAAAFLAKMSESLQTQQQYALLADLAATLGQDHSAIQVALQAEKEIGVTLGEYAYPQKIRAISGVRDVEWALVHSLMRQESRFDQMAVSHAGARGLMQLMPATAKQTARKLGVAHQLGWLTSRPDHNILLGSRYLKQMLERYNGSYPMAIAAYNAGPGRVDRWITEIGDPRNGRIDLIDWVELIPIYETRNYVQRVMEGTYVYRHMLGTKNKPASPLHIASR